MLRFRRWRALYTLPVSVLGLMQYVRYLGKRENLSFSWEDFPKRGFVLFNVNHCNWNSTIHAMHNCTCPLPTTTNMLLTDISQHWKKIIRCYSLWWIPHATWSVHRGSWRLSLPLSLYEPWQKNQKDFSLLPCHVSSLHGLVPFESNVETTFQQYSSKDVTEHPFVQYSCPRYAADARFTNIFEFFSKATTEPKVPANFENTV